MNNKSANYSMTQCTKTGIKIHNGGNNEYKIDPFADATPFFQRQERQERQQHINQPQTNQPQPQQPPQTIQSPQGHMIDLNIENYSREELYKLFGFNSLVILSEDDMKEAKKIALKTHPDKSRLDNKYFVFFSEAYNKLKSIYEFQNKSFAKKEDTNTYYEDQNKQLLDNMFMNKKSLKDKDNFNDWFNGQFDKHRLDDPIEHGYDSWLKSDEDVIFTPQNINKDNMGREMEKRKKAITALTPYTGVGDIVMTSSAGGSSLMEYNSNFSSGTLFSSDGMGYTDLKQAYAESVIPVSEEDFHKVKQYRNVDEYKRHRDEVNVAPISKEESLRQLYTQDKKQNEESAALAFYYAQQSEKARKNDAGFWANIKQLNW